MTDKKAAAKKFYTEWNGRGYERGDCQPFWLSLLRDVFGVPDPEQFIFFEEKVFLDHTSFIDASIPSTHVLIEQKGLGKDLSKPIRQSDGSLLTPFQQAKRYAAELPYSRRPRWIVTCNFSEFHVYDMERPGGDPEVILLKDLPEEYYRLRFLVDTENESIKKEMEVSLQAGELVGVLYDALLGQYADPADEHALKSLNMLCVRLVFCLYAEDAGIFGRHGMFHDYLASFPARDARRALLDLAYLQKKYPLDRNLIRSLNREWKLNLDLGLCYRLFPEMFPEEQRLFTSDAEIPERARYAIRRLALLEYPESIMPFLANSSGAAPAGKTSEPHRHRLFRHFRQKRTETEKLRALLAREFPQATELKLRYRREKDC